MDTMGCQREVAKKIVGKRADYILVVKANQAGLHKAIQACFNALDVAPQAMTHFVAEATERHHGRQETRRVTTLNAVAYLPEKQLWDWPKLKTLVRVESMTVRSGKTASQTRYFITSLPTKEVDTIAKGVRSHWGIENRLHWGLDVVFNEDANRTRKGHGPESSAILRHIVLNLLRQDPIPFGSIKTRCMRAALSPNYRMDALLRFPVAEGQGIHV